MCTLQRYRNYVDNTQYCSTIKYAKCYSPCFHIDLLVACISPQQQQARKKIGHRDDFTAKKETARDERRGRRREASDRPTDHSNKKAKQSNKAKSLYI